MRTIHFFSSMKRRSAALGCSLLVCATALTARRPQTPGCGTHAGNAQEELFLHNQALRLRGLTRSLHRKSFSAAAISTNRDYGDVAVMDDSGGVIARRNAFNLAHTTISFTPTAPSAARYYVSRGAASFDADAAARGALVAGLSDDDAREVSIPFSFPFFGASYRSVFINSDGNLTFGSGDASATDRSLGRMIAGPPRIAPLFADLDPSAARAGNGLKVLVEAERVVVTWAETPLWQSAGFGPEQTFQLRLYPDGRIEFAYGAAGSGLSDCVVGIAPGALRGAASLVSFTEENPGDFSAAIVERFSSSDAVDIATTAQKFFATHDDAYDYLVIYNTAGAPASPSAVAYEVTTRNHRSGYGDKLVDIGEEFGSPRRLQAVINMGPLSQYPADPAAHVALRGPTADTPVTILGHEAGHLFLAFASIPDPSDPRAAPMLGRDGAHWAFTFNSEASLLEGNRIEDKGPAASPRFTTVANVQGYSPLDQYLMGFRAASEVPDAFAVLNSGQNPSRAPQNGVSFDGDRLNVTVDALIAAQGRRTPDYTVAQRRFRFAFLLITPSGVAPSAAELAQVNAYRTAFERAYPVFASSRAFADTSLKRGLQFSAAPALGVIQGASATASIALDSPAPTPLTVFFEQASGSTGRIEAPASVAIPAGSSRISFSFTGTQTGVVELTARPSDSAYETAYARVQVLASAAMLKLALISGDRQIAVPGSPLAHPIAVQATDINGLPYPGVSVTAAVSSGSLDSDTLATDQNGVAAFRWTPGSAGPYEFRAAIAGAPAQSVAAQAIARPAVFANGIVNAASFVPGITPGALASIFGSNLTAGVVSQAASLPLPVSLAGVQLLLNNSPAPLLYVSDSQINFLVPADLTGSNAEIRIVNPAADSASYTVNVTAAAPGIFFDPATGNGAVLLAGTSQSTFDHPARPGDVIEIYGTGLGRVVAAGALQQTVAAPQALIAGIPAPVLFSGLSPQFPGLYQVNAQVPEGVPDGVGTLSILVDGARSNEVKVRLAPAINPPGSSPSAPLPPRLIAPAPRTSAAKNRRILQ
jgi:uncharacterized protein (TIGR03437 family)